ncbi:MAG TPA: hypothetical protein VEW45_07660 [Candidatus Dormibacteraeota bacterium]|nr:hypothetical protein [Candidatus Dormibacteraeota bacterium]
MPIARYAVVAVLAVLGLVGLMLLVRPLIFSLAPPLDDANYRLIATSSADQGVQLVEIVLNQPHGLLGEVIAGEHAGLTAAVAPVLGTGRYTVVNAWSPTNDCPIELGPDRLVDCAGDAWTYEGFPIDPADPLLQRFAATVRTGAVVVDFTHPIDEGAS